MSYFLTIAHAQTRNNQKEVRIMAQYELVREIQNLCRNNQMRDISFQEVECADPESYVRELLKGKNVELSELYQSLLPLIGNFTLHCEIFVAFSPAKSKACLE